MFFKVATQFSSGSSSSTAGSLIKKEEKVDSADDQDYEDFNDFDDVKPKRLVLPFAAIWKITEEHFIFIQMANDRTWTIDARLDDSCKVIYLTCERKAPELTHFQDLLVQSKLPFTEEEEKEILSDLGTLDTRKVFQFPCPEGRTWEPKKWTIETFTTRPQRVKRSEKKMAPILSPIQKWRLLAIPIVKPLESVTVNFVKASVSSDSEQSEDESGDKAFFLKLSKLVDKKNRSSFLKLLGDRKSSAIDLEESDSEPEPNPDEEEDEDLGEAAGGDTEEGDKADESSTGKMQAPKISSPMMSKLLKMSSPKLSFGTPLSKKRSVTERLRLRR